MKYFISLIFFAGTLFSEQKLIDLSKPDEIIGHEFLVGCARSGNNWLITILQILLKKPCRRPGMPSLCAKNDLGLNRLGLNLDYCKPILYRTHHFSPVFKKIDQSKNKLIFIIRNYKECLVRHHRYTAQELYDVVLNDTHGFKDYINNLQSYDDWKDENTKLLIHYEDLISNPREVIEELLAFLGEGTEGLDEFFDQYEYWRKKSINSYKSQHNGMPSSGGKKELFHSKNFPIELLRSMDKHLQQTYPSLWEKYLFKYDT